MPLAAKQRAAEEKRRRAEAEAADEALQAAIDTKASQAALDEVFAGLQVTSAQAASNGMNIQTLQGAAASLFESVGGLDARVTANAAAIEKKAPQSALNSTDQALAALTVEVAGKQAQLLAGDVEGDRKSVV
jgi:prophage DNA circulation protein